MANTVQPIVITAVDQASAVINNVEHSLAGLAGTFSNLAGALGVGLSVGGITAWAKGVVEAASSLENLSRATGSSVEGLSRLQNQAKISGVDFGVFSAALERMAAGMAGTGETGGKAAQALRQLGIESRDPAQALEELASKLNEYQDGVGKAALARDIFGRGGPQFLAMLHDLAAAHGLAATTSTEQAKAAEELEQSMRRFGVEATAAKEAILSQLVPALQTVIDTFRLSRTSGLDFLQSARLAIDDLFGDDKAARVDALRKNIAWYNEEIRKANEQGNTKWAEQFAEYVRKASAEMAVLLGLQGKFNTLQSEAMSREQVAKGVGGTGDKWDRFLQGKQGAPLEAFQPLPYKTPGGTDQIEEFRGVIERLREEYEKLSGEDGGMSEVVKAQDAINRALAAGKPLTLDIISAWLNYAEAVDTTRKQLADAKKAEDEQRKALEAQRAAYHQYVTDMANAAAAWSRFTAGLDKENADRQFNLSLLGKTTDQVKLLVAAHEAEMRTAEEATRLTIARDKALAENREVATEYQRQLDLLPELGKARVKAATDAMAAEIAYQNSFAGGWTQAFNTYMDSVKAATIAQEAFNDLTRMMENLFVGMAHNAKNAFRNFANAVLAMIEQIAAKLLTSGIMRLLSGGTFSFSGGALASGGAGGAGNWMESAAGSAVGNSIFGVGGLGGALGGVADSIGLSAGMGNLGLSLGLGGEVATWMAANAVPIVGTVLVVAGSLIYNWLESKKGGPKSGGYAQSGAVDLSGTESYGGRWFTPNTNDADVQKIITGITTDYATLVKALRGTSAAGLGFALGYDTDPQGKAPNRVHAGVWAGGQQIYNMAYSDLGRDQATLDATLALEAKRMLIAALKASDLPGQLGKMFSSLQIENLTAETADNILKFSQAYLELYDILNASPVDDALEAIELAAGGASAALDKQAEALQALIDQYDGTADSTVALATATKAYYAATVALVIQIEQAKKALAALFAGSIKEYTFAKLDKGGQYKYLQDEIDRYYAELKTSSNPGRVEELAKYIDADMREAFGLLTPEQQSSLADQFIQMAEEVNKTASDQLSKAEQAQEEKLNALLTQIQAALDAAAEKIFKGGTAVGEGGADIKEAAAYLVRAGGDSLVTG